MIGKYSYLIKKRIVTDQDLQKALSISQNLNQSVETILIKHFQVPKDFIGKALSRYHNCNFIAYDPHIPAAEEMFFDLDKYLLLNGCWVPISWDYNGIVVLVDDPSDSEKRHIICTSMKTTKIIYAVGIKEDIAEFISQFFEKVEVVKLFLAEETEDRPTDFKRIVNTLLSEACRHDASDIYFEPSETPGKTTVLFCMDGENLEYMTVLKQTADNMIKRIKSMANLDVEDSKLPKIGHIKFMCDGLKEFRITVTTYPTGEYGELVALKFSPLAETIGLDKCQDTQ